MFEGIMQRQLELTFLHSSIHSPTGLVTVVFILFQCVGLLPLRGGAGGARDKSAVRHSKDRGQGAERQGYKTLGQSLFPAIGVCYYNTWGRVSPQKKRQVS